MDVSASDLHKIRDVLVAAERHHVARDEMNAALHLAPQARLSPLTSQIQCERERCDRLLGESVGGP